MDNSNITKLILPICFNLVLSLSSSAESLSVNVNDSKGNRLTGAVIYVQSANPMKPAQMGSVLIEQLNKEFNPFISVVPVGTSILFPNRDAIGHHVYSFSSSKTFELPLSENETNDSVLFDAPGIVTVGCNIHDWMVAYIYVVNSPYYGKTGDDGIASIVNIPTGEYSLYIWHPGMKNSTDIEQKITIGTDVPNQHTFSIEIRPEYFWKPERPAENEEEEY